MEHAELSAADSLTEAVCGVIIHKYTDRGWVADPRLDCQFNPLRYHQYQPTRNVRTARHLRRLGSNPRKTLRAAVRAVSDLDRMWIRDH